MSAASVFTPAAPAQISARLAQLVPHAAQLQARFDFRATERRIFLLLLALDTPVGIARVRHVVKAMRRSPLYDKVRRLQHGTALYRELGRLDDLDAMERSPAGRARLFVLRPAFRLVFEATIGETSALAGADDVVTLLAAG